MKGQLGRGRFLGRETVGMQVEGFCILEVRKVGVKGFKVSRFGGSATLAPNSSLIPS